MDRYRLERRLGAGGMAEVYEATLVGEAGFERRVAIKRLAAERAADPSFLRMFLDEARIAASLHHASIVGVIDYGVVDGLPFQVLEYVDGADAGTLRERGAAAAAPMPLEAALAIALEAARALDHAHRARGPDGAPLGIVHRDVKPANLLVAWSGDVKLSDFGIAVARGRLEQTEAGVAKGTLAFMAPEQMMRAALDGRTDLFALGCTLQALACGTSPMEREGALSDLLAGAAPEIDASLPADVVAIVARALRPRAEERFADAAAMAAAIEAALAARVSGDPRGPLRAWLARLQAAEAAAGAARPKRGLLDQLLDLEMVPSEEAPSQAGERRFSLRHTRATASPPSPARLAARPPDDTRSAAARPRRWRWLAGLALAAGASAALAVGLASSTSAPRAAALSSPAPDAAASVAAVTAADASAPEPQPQTQVDAAPLDQPRPDAAVRHARPPRPDAGVASAPPPAVTGSGHVRIGGERLLKAQIFVDGKPAGYAPRLLELPAGPHTLSFTLADGTRLGPIQIDVTPRHTRSNPLIPLL